MPEESEESRANNVRPYGKVLSSKPIFKIVPLEKAPEGCALCWDVSVADRGICRGRCPHRPVPFFENENL